MAVAKAAAKPRTVTRDEPEARMPPREAPARDPNKLYTRDGREIDLHYIANQHNDDYSNLAAVGIFPPDGWVYEWRTRKIKNAEYVKAIVADDRAGWTPVPAERHPGKIMPRGHEGPIEHEGQMLMERPVAAVALSRRMDKKEADSRLMDSRQRMSGIMQREAPNSGAIADFDHPDAVRASGFRKVSEAGQSGIVAHRNYTYSLDE